MNEQLEQSVLDYMLYYVMVRSQDADKMEYKTIIRLIDSLLAAQPRVQSASKKSRPESSSPEKLKLRNPTKA